MKAKQRDYQSIDEYIQSFPRNVQKRLRELRRLVRDQAPQAEEKISYQMPTYFLRGNLVHFAAYEKHIGFYPTPSAIRAFRRELSRYKNAKGSVRFPLEEPLPKGLIRKMVRFRVKENSDRNRQQKE